MVLTISPTGSQGPSFLAQILQTQLTEYSPVTGGQGLISIYLTGEDKSTKNVSATTESNIN
jgi:hypothetical protein